MKKILIKGKQGVGKTTLATMLALNGNSIHTYLDGFTKSCLNKYRNIIIDEVGDSDRLRDLFKSIDKESNVKIIVTTQSDIDESLFDYTFNLK